MKFSGQVIRGVQVGSKFGIATANLGFETVPELQEGVYIVQVQVPQSPVLIPGLLHFGERKTFGADFSAEVHLLDFDQDIYGATLEVEVITRLRDVITFPNSDALFSQIERDILHARKHFARQNIKAQWKNLNPQERESLSLKALEKVEKLKNFQESLVIYAYAPDDQEIPFVEKLCEKYPTKTWCFPRIEVGKMKFYAAAYHDLKPGYLGLLEPETNQVRTLGSPDLVLVPAVAATLDGHRLGRGGGFYDRFLSQTEAPTLCVLPDFARLEEVPVEPHDQPVDQVIFV